MDSHSPTTEDCDYIPVLDSATAMIDTALGFIERQVDEFGVSIYEGEADAGVYRGLSSRSLAEKLDIVLDDEDEPLEEEYGTRWFWGTARELIVLRQALESGDADLTLREWFTRDDYVELAGSPEVSEPLRSELALQWLLNGLLTYLDGWLSAVAADE